MSSPSGDELTKSAQVYPPKGQPAVPPVHSGSYPPPYHGFAQPYPGYPNPAQHYPPPRPPSNTAYYASSQLPYLYPEQKKGYTFAQIVLCMMIVLIICATVMSVLMWYIFGSDVPKFRLTSFSVPSFVLGNSSLTAIWEVNVTVKNPNHKLVVNFDRIESILAYKVALLDTSLVDPIQVNKGDCGTLHITFAVPTNHHNSTEAFWLKDIGDDRKKGSIVFDLRIIMQATFNSGHIWTSRLTTLRTLCGDIKVEFSAPTGGGTWNGTKQDCILFN